MPLHYEAVSAKKYSICNLEAEKKMVRCNATKHNANNIQAPESRGSIDAA